MKTLIVCLIYLAVLGIISYRIYKRTHSASEYLIGNRRTHQMVMALSYGATFISTSAVIGFGGLASSIGFSILWLAFLTVGVGVLLAFIVFGKRTHKMGLKYNAHTFSELLGKRFDSKLLQVSSGLAIFLFMPIYTAAVIKGGVNFIEVYFGIPYDVCLFIFVSIVALYVLTGGLKAVMSTDFVQALILFTAMVVLVAVTYFKLGGISGAHTKLTELFADTGVRQGLEGMVSNGFAGWTSMPEFNSPLWWSVVSSVAGAVGIGVLAQPQLVVRFMTVKSTKDLNRAVLSGGIFIVVMTAGAFVVGALANVIIHADTGMLARAAAGSNDSVIPYYITNYMPSWYGALFLLAMLAAAMSTLSSQFHTMGAAVGYDVGGVLMPKYKDSLKINRLGTLLVILLSLLIAWGAKYLDATDAVIAKGTIIFYEMTICAFLPVYIAALFCKNMPKRAAEAGMFAGLAVWFVWTFFISAGAANLMLCELLTGKAYLLEGSSFDRIAALGSSFIGVFASVVTMIAVWIASEKPAIEVEVAAE